MTYTFGSPRFLGDAKEQTCSTFYLKEKRVRMTIVSVNYSAALGLCVLRCQADLAARISTVAPASVSPVPRFTAAPNPVSRLAPSSQWRATWICLHMHCGGRRNSYYQYCAMNSQKKANVVVNVSIYASSSGMEDWMAE